MNIHLSRTMLRQIGWQELALRFILGGVITASAGVIAMKFGPVIGGLFLAFPAILPASLTLVDKHEVHKKTEKRMNGRRRGRQAAAADAAGATFGSVGIIAFGFIIWQFAQKYNPWTVLASATLIWAAVSIGFWAIRKNVTVFMKMLCQRGGRA